MERARLAAGFTIPEVATKLHRCTATIRRWELGQTTPPRALMVALCDLYGCTPAALVDEGLPAPGTAEAIAYVRAHLAGDLDTQATILLAVQAGGMPALGALTLSLCHLLRYSAGPDLADQLDNAHARLVGG